MATTSRSLSIRPGSAPEVCRCDGDPDFLRHLQCFLPLLGTRAPLRLAHIAGKVSRLAIVPSRYTTCAGAP